MTKFGFCDLNISDQQTEKDLVATCDMLVKLGYQTIAINHFVGEPVVQQTESKKKKGLPPVIVPSPINIDYLKQKFNKKLRILHRLTVVVSNKEQAYTLSKSPQMKEYNLIAILPLNEVAFQTACSTMEIDIISFCPGLGGAKGTSWLKVNRKMYNLATERGIFFELAYAPAVRDSAARKNTIHMAHTYHAHGKSKNIIITSAAENSFHIRGPYDIINLGLLFGLSEEQAKAAITSTCRQLLISADGRRHGKALILVKPLVDLPKCQLEAQTMEVKTETQVSKKRRLQ